MSDLISRRAAIAAVSNWLYDRDDGRSVDQLLSALPSAQPEKRTEERTETHACDSVDRQAAINALKGLPTWWADAGGYYGDAQPPMTALLDPEDAISAIENLPSAQPHITHCAECIHWKHSAVRKSYCEVFDWMNKAEDFCSFAERRTNGRD